MVKRVNFYRAAQLIVVLSSFMTLNNVNAKEFIAPETIPNTVKVDAEGVIEAVNSDPRLVLIDARIAIDREQGFIQDSISLPDVTINCDMLAKAVPDKTQPTLFYCNGPRCGRSIKAIHVAQSCGYTNIYWFRGGFEEWKAKGYPFVKE